jgi:hypothetical protein
MIYASAYTYRATLWFDFVNEQESVQSLAGKLRDAASLRVDGSGEAEVVYHGAVLDPGATLAQAWRTPTWAR